MKTITLEVIDMGYADYKDEAKAKKEAAANLAEKNDDDVSPALETIFTEALPLAAGIGAGLYTMNPEVGFGVYGGAKGLTKGIMNEDAGQAIMGAGKGYMAVKGGMDGADQELIQLYQTEGADALDDEQMDRLLELDEMTQSKGSKGHSFGKGKSE